MLDTVREFAYDRLVESGEEPDLRSRHAAWCQDLVDEAIAAKRIVGTVVMVARNGALLHHRAAGLADREAGRPMTEDTIFRFASISKPLTSAVALALIERGKMGLDDPVTRFLPEFRPKLPDGREPQILIGIF